MIIIAFERCSGKWFVPELLITPRSKLFLNDFTQIQRARFSHNKSQQLHPNNDFNIAVEIAKAPSATIILLLLLLLVPSSSILPYHVGCYCYCCYY